MPALMSEMERCSVAKIVPPDINHSTVEFFTDYKTNEIYWSLSRIKFVGIRTAEYIVKERLRSDFKGVEDFIERIFYRKLNGFRARHWDTIESTDNNRVPVNTRHLKNMILAGCFDRVENVKSVTERYSILKRAAAALRLELTDSDAPAELRDKHYFWSQQQIAVSGIGMIDYRRIFDNSPDRASVKGKASYIPLADVLRRENEKRRAAICATVSEYSEHSYKDQETGMSKRFVKLLLSQNGQTVECVLWDEFYKSHKSELTQISGKIIILTAMIRYSHYSGCNTLQSYHNSLLFIQ